MNWKALQRKIGNENKVKFKDEEVGWRKDVKWIERVGKVNCNKVKEKKKLNKLLKWIFFLLKGLIENKH